MIIENEITFLVKTDYKNLKKELTANGFVEKRNVQVNDIYLIDSRIDYSSLEILDILKNCVLIRNIVGFEKELLYKYKEYNVNGDITKQGKVKCPITDIDKALRFMETIKYKKLFNISDNCIVYANKYSELTVQKVNNKYIFIEMELNTYNKKRHKNVEDLKNEICRYNLSIDKSNFFVKKAEIILKEKLQ